MFTFLSQECKKGQAKARPILSKNTAISQSTKASVLLTQMYRGKNLGNSKPGFCKQNPGTRHQASLMTASAGGLRAAFFFMFAPEAQKVTISCSAEHDRGLCPLDTHHLLKKVDENFFFSSFVQFYFQNLRQVKACPYIFSMPVKIVGVPVVIAGIVELLAHHPLLAAGLFNQVGKHPVDGFHIFDVLQMNFP